MILHDRLGSFASFPPYRHFRFAPILLKNSLLQPPHAADSLPLGLAGDLSDDRRAVGDAGEFVLPLSG